MLTLEDKRWLIKLARLIVYAVYLFTIDEVNSATRNKLYAYSELDRLEEQ